MGDFLFSLLFHTMKCQSHQRSINASTFSYRYTARWSWWSSVSHGLAVEDVLIQPARAGAQLVNALPRFARLLFHAPLLEVVAAVFLTLARQVPIPHPVHQLVVMLSCFVL